MEMFSIAFTLFLLMDSVGNIPLFIAVLQEIPPKRQMVIILRELIIALSILILFFFIGETVLTFLSVERYSVSLSGGIILFLIALKMIFPKQGQTLKDLFQGEPFIVPLAVPLVAGPAAIAAVMLYAFQQEQSSLVILGGICIAWLATTIILLSSPFLKRILGNRGTAAIERLMGLILVMIAIQMFLEGVIDFLQNVSI